MLLFLTVLSLLAADVPQHASLSGRLSHRLLARLASELEPIKNTSVVKRRKRRRQTDTRASRQVPGQGIVHERNMHGVDGTSRIRKRHHHRRHEHKKGATGEGRAPTMLLRLLRELQARTSAESAANMSNMAAHLTNRNISVAIGGISTTGDAQGSAAQNNTIISPHASAPAKTVRRTSSAEGAALIGLVQTRRYSGWSQVGCVGGCF